MCVCVLWTFDAVSFQEQCGKMVKQSQYAVFVIVVARKSSREEGLQAASVQHLVNRRTTLCQ